MYEIDFEKFKDIFFAEAKEHLDSVDASLANLREDPKNTNALFELFRVAHTLKSMSATMGFDKITPLATSLSRTLDKFHKGKAISTAETVVIVKECFDAIKTLVADAASGADSKVPVDALVEKLQAITEVKQGDQEIDIIKDMFFSEVKGYLESVHEPLSKLIITPDDRGLLFEMFRIAHTIKGMAATMNFEKMTQLATAMSAVLNKLRDGQETSTENGIRVIAASFDTLDALVKEAAAGENWDIAVDPRIEQLNALLKH